MLVLHAQLCCQGCHREGALSRSGRCVLEVLLRQQTRHTEKLVSLQRVNPYYEVPCGDFNGYIVAYKRIASLHPVRLPQYR